MKPTKEEIKLISPCYNAIKVIVGERKCEKCGGSGYNARWNMDQRDFSSGRKCPKCSGTGKVGWVWKPEVGEWYLLYNKLYLVNDPLIVRERFIEVWGKDAVKPIPILPWETIEQILEDTGQYMVDTEKLYLGGVVKEYKCHIEAIHSSSSINKYAKSRTRAVYEAVIALAKEMPK